MMDFADRLIRWFQENKREMPWRLTRDPYRIWVSEIMLQQTQVDTVIPYYERFIKRFPSLEALAEADLDEVLALWQGLGYYRRAENLHRGARYILSEYEGSFPENLDSIRKVPGIGAYTAGAILSIAFGRPAPAVDGNVMRVLSRQFLVEHDIALAKSRKVFEEIEVQLIKGDPGTFIQAMMELGALICIPKKPRCLDCPVSVSCQACLGDKIERYPVKTKKPKPVRERYWVLIFKKDDGYWMEKRPKGGLLGDLWGFPLVGEAQWRQMEALLHNKRCLMQVSHVFTHRQWELNPVLIELEDMNSPLPMNLTGFSDQGGFMTGDEIRRLPVPTAFRKITNQLDA